MKTFKINHNYKTPAEHKKKHRLSTKSSTPRRAKVETRKRETEKSERAIEREEASYGPSKWKAYESDATW